MIHSKTGFFERAISFEEASTEFSKCLLLRPLSVREAPYPELYSAFECASQHRQGGQVFVSILFMNNYEMFFFADAAQSGSNLGRSLVDAFAAFWEGGEGPKHTIIDRKIAAAGMVPTADGSKEKKIVDAFMAANDEQAYLLMCGLLEALRQFSTGQYSRGKLEDTNAGLNLRRAIESAGYSLNENFELSDHEKGPVAQPTPQTKLNHSWASVPVAHEKQPAPATQPLPQPKLDEAWLFDEFVPPADDKQQAPAAQISPEEKAIIQKAEVKKTPPKEIFLVHGHDELNMHKVSDWVHVLTGVKPIILSNQLNKGMTLIEKFESYSADSACAIVLMTPDDEARAKREPESALVSRARENVVFELGYFYGKLKRENVIVLNFGVKLPGDVHGLVYIGEAEWKVDLGAELAGLGYRAHL